MEIHRNYLSSLSLVLALAGCAEDGPEPDFGPGVDLPGDETGETDDGTGGGSGSGGGTSAGDDSDGGGGTGGGTSGGLDQDGDGCISPDEIELPVVFPEHARRTDPTGYREYGPEDQDRDALVLHCPPCLPLGPGNGDSRCLTDDWHCGCGFETGCLEHGFVPRLSGSMIVPTPIEEVNVFTCVLGDQCPAEYVKCNPHPDSGELCGPEDLYPGDAYPCQISWREKDDSPWAPCWGYCY